MNIEKKILYCVFFI